LIAVLTDPAVGGTFLTWSLHYLAGHDNYYQAKSGVWIDLPHNPLTEKNSHGFLANHPESKSFDDIYSSLVSTKTNNFHTIYLSNDVSNVESFDLNLEKCISSLRDEQLILLTLSTPHQLYQSSSRTSRLDPASMSDLNKILDNATDAEQDFNEHFFKNSFQTWQNLNLTSYWDRREFLALNLRPKKTIHICPNIDLNCNHYRLDTMELWNTFDLTVDHLFKYLGLTIKSERRSHWNTVYQKWRKLHYQKILFVWYFDQIIDYILQGYNFDLTRFNLDINQESAIQHELIYTHNLNLKTWQQEKFTNTKQLHDLLEPNIHPLQNT